jgi:hypothetical protein
MTFVQQKTPEWRNWQTRGTCLPAGRFKIGLVRTDNMTI